MPTSYEFAQMQLTRFRPVRRRAVSFCFLGLRRKKALPPCKALTLLASTASAGLDCTARNAVGSKHSLNNRRFTNSAVGWLRKSPYLSRHRTPRALPTAMLKPRLRGAARRAHGSSALVHAMRNLIASHAPLRSGSHKARQAYTKTLPQGIQGAANRGPAKAQR